MEEKTTWKDRLRGEIVDLDGKMARLENTLSKMSTSDPDYTLLTSQFIHMNDYMNDLITRASCHGIDISRPSFEVSSNTNNPMTDCCCCLASELSNSKALDILSILSVMNVLNGGE